MQAEQRDEVMGVRANWGGVSSIVTNHICSDISFNLDCFQTIIEYYKLFTYQLYSLFVINFNSKTVIL